MLRHTLLYLLLALVVAVAAANTDNSDMVRRMNAIIDRNFQGINKGTALKKDGRLVTIHPLLFCGALDYNAPGHQFLNTIRDGSGLTALCTKTPTDATCKAVDALITSFAELEAAFPVAQSWGPDLLNICPPGHRPRWRKSDARPVRLTWTP